MIFKHEGSSEELDFDGHVVSEYNGQEFTIVRELDSHEYDEADTGKMFRVEFSDGVRIDVYAQEIGR